MSDIRRVYKKSWAIVCSDRDKAIEIIEEIAESPNRKIVDRRCGIHSIDVLFDDNTALRWINPRTTERWFRFGRMWCESGISYTVLSNIIMPMYFGRKEDITWI